jgi:ribonucleoside-diphosphate reductase alpha chain
MLSIKGKTMVVKTDSTITIDYSRNNLLKELGKKTLEDRYLLPGEGPQDLFARVAGAFSDNPAHAQRLYDYMSQLWFMPATPILSNGGTDRGLPISCFLNEVPDSLEGIVDTWNDNVWLSAKGGGIGTYWGNVRSIGESVRKAGETSGVIPFIHVQDSLTLAISQGSLRRGAAAVYLPVDHPEIEEFLEIRKASGDFNRKGLNLNHGICISDLFMCAVRDGTVFSLLSPVDQKVIKTVDARELWQRILETRLQTGEPYIIFIDTVNKSIPKFHQAYGLTVKTSNLCSEITLPTNEKRTAVCCLASLNLETYDEWKDNEIIVEDILRMLDNVLTDFALKTNINNAAYSAMRERSVGLGVMGFHSFLQSRGLPFESLLAKSWNKYLFKKIKEEANAASVQLAHEKGACKDADLGGYPYRFSNMIAIAPTASISVIAGGSSPGIEPFPANVYNHKTLSGSYIVKNKYLEELLDGMDYGEGTDIGDVWQSIIEHEGSVQHLPFLSARAKEIFKTAFEIDQRCIIDLAADRQKYICQSQSLNLFLPSNINKHDLHQLHFTAWEKGIKSLYYVRSRSARKAEFVGESKNYSECLACQ